MFGRNPALKQSCRSDDNEVHVGAYANGNHIFCHLPGEAHAGVKALGNDVRAALVGDDFKIDVGIGLEEFSQPRPQNCIGCMFTRGDANGAGWPFAHGANRRDFSFNLIKLRG